MELKIRNNKNESKRSATLGDAGQSQNVQTAQVINPINTVVAPAIEDADAVEIKDEPKAEKKPVTLKRKVTIKKKQSEKTKAAKASRTTKAEADKALPKVGFTTYKTKKGKDAPMIIGFAGEDDPRWKPIHDDKPKWVSASYRTRPDGTKDCYMMFGTRYMDAAKQLTNAYNQADKMEWHKAEEACVKVYEQAVADGKARWEEKKQHWAEAKAEKKSLSPDPSPNSEGSAKTYTAEDVDKAVADALKKVLAGGALPESVKKLMAA